jgi:hypothetical protein
VEKMKRKPDRRGLCRVSGLRRLPHATGFPGRHRSSLSGLRHAEAW